MQEFQSDEETVNVKVGAPLPHVDATPHVDPDRRESKPGRQIHHDYKFHLDRLRRTGKIERAAFLDLEGKVIARSPGMEVTLEDGETIATALTCSYKGMTKLRVGKQDFTCFRNTPTSLVGRDDRDILCIYKGSGLIVVGITDPESPGSSIYELTRFLKHLNRTSNESRPSFAE